MTDVQDDAPYAEQPAPEDEEKEEGPAVESVFWVCCESCNKWRKVAREYGEEETFHCAHISRSCAEACDGCSNPTCICDQLQQVEEEEEPEPEPKPKKKGGGRKRKADDDGPDFITWDEVSDEDLGEEEEEDEGRKGRSRARGKKKQRDESYDAYAEGEDDDE